MQETCGDVDDGGLERQPGAPVNSTFGFLPLVVRKIEAKYFKFCWCLLTVSHNHGSRV